MYLLNTLPPWSAKSFLPVIWQFKRPEIAKRGLVSNNDFAHHWWSSQNLSASCGSVINVSVPGTVVFYPLQNHEKCCKWSVFHSLLLLKKCNISPAWVCLCVCCRGRFWLVLWVFDALVCIMRFPNHLVTGVFRWLALSLLLLSQC